MIDEDIGELDVCMYDLVFVKKIQSLQEAVYELENLAHALRDRTFRMVTPPVSI